MADRDTLLSTLTISDAERSQTGGASVLKILAGIGAVILLGGVVYFTPLSDVFFGTEEAEAAKGAANTTAASVPAVKVLKSDTAPSASSASTASTQASPITATESANPSGGTRAGGAATSDEDILNAAGYVTARRIATVSAELTGLITDVLIEEGMSVKAGQPLAYLDYDIAQAEYKLASARVRAAKAATAAILAEFDEAQRDLERAKSLKAGDYATEARVTAAESRVLVLKARIDGSRADEDIATYDADRLRSRFADHTIRAPFDGVVVVKAAQPGEIVSPVSAGGGFTRTGICTIVDMNSLEIEVDVNEAFIARVFEGQKITANLDAYPDLDIPARVAAIIPTADRAKATVRVRIEILDRDSRILPDMGVKVAFLKS